MKEEENKRKDSKFHNHKKKGKTHSIHKNIENPTDEDIIEFMEVGKKNKENMEMLTNYCKKNERLMAILHQSSSNEDSTSQDVFISNIAREFEYLHCSENAALFNYGDTGDKFYVLLKGEAAVLIAQEKIVNLTFCEYIGYLCNLSRYNETGLLTKCLENNCSVYNVTFDLIDGVLKTLIKSSTPHNLGTNKVPSELKIYKQDDQKPEVDEENTKRHGSLRRMSQQVTLRRHYNSVGREIKCLKDYLYMLDNPEVSSIDLDAIIPFMSTAMYKNRNIFKKLIVNASGINYQIKKSGAFDEATSHNIEKRILTDEEKEKIRTEKKQVKTYRYINVKTFKNGDLFGEIALQTSKNKRTATIFVTQPSHFLYLIKQSFDDTIGALNIKVLNDKLKFLKTIQIFHHYPAQLLYENYYRFFTTIKLFAGGFLQRQGKAIKKTFFIKKGTFEVYINSSLSQVSEFLDQMEFRNDFFHQVQFHNSNNEQFHAFMKKQRRFLISKLSEGELAGLDYYYLNTENSIATIQCTSESSELFCLENHEFYKLLSDYNKWKYSLSSENTTSIKKEIKKEEKEKEKTNALALSLMEILKSGANQEKEDQENEPKELVVEEIFDINVPKNPIHSSWLKYRKSKQQSITDRLKEILNVHLNRFISKAPEFVFGIDDCPESILLSPIANKEIKTKLPKSPRKVNTVASSSTLNTRKIIKQEYQVECRSYKHWNRDPKSISLSGANNCFMNKSMYDLKSLQLENKKVEIVDCASINNDSHLISPQSLGSSKFILDKSYHNLKYMTLSKDNESIKVRLKQNTKQNESVMLSRKNVERLKSKATTVMTNQSLSLFSQKISDTSIRAKFNPNISNFHCIELIPGVESSPKRKRITIDSPKYIEESTQVQKEIVNKTCDMTISQDLKSTLNTFRGASTFMIKSPINDKFSTINQKELSSLKNNDLECLKELRNQARTSNTKIVFSYSRSRILNLSNSLVKSKYSIQLRNMNLRKAKENSYL